MGFLTKFFSLGGKRSKRQWKQHTAEQYANEAPPPLPVTRRNQEDHEATVNRLLRSSSSNIAAIEEEVERTPQQTRLGIPSIQRHSGTSTMSTTSLASTCTRGTYTVTVYPRTVLAQTEFPNANPEVPSTPRNPKHDSLRRRSKSAPGITPKDKARLLGLRADPSVASLLNMYDEHGCLDSKVFSNSPSPQKEGRVQTHRTGSTLRELLGGSSSLSSRKDPERNNSAGEGDLSWAERWLSESANTSTSSLIQTPNDAHFIHDHLNHTLSDSHGFTINQSDAQPVFSSLEVELSMGTEGTIRTPTKFSDNPYTKENYAHPHRASEIFDFLTAKKTRPRVYSQPEERSFERATSLLPEPVQPTSRFSVYSSGESEQSDTSPHRDTPTDVHTEPEIPEMTDNTPNGPSSSMWIAHDSTAKMFRQDPEDNSMIRDSPRLHQVIINSSTEAKSDRVRGPRPPPKSGSHSAKPTPNEAICDIEHTRPVEDVFQLNCATASAPDLSMDDDALSLAPLHPSHRSTASRSSANLPPMPLAQKPAAVEAPYIPKHIRRKQPASKWARIHDKENNRGAAQELPTTPVRTSVFRPAPPSPASSSDLSPLAQQLMADLRTQRAAARPRYKRPGNGKWSTTTSKLKF